MLKRIIQACFLIVGGTLGMFLIPELLNVLHANDMTYFKQSLCICTVRCYYFLSYYFLVSGSCC